MAGDWIKMRVGLTTNPKVMRLAECLLEDPDFLEWSSLSIGIPTVGGSPDSLRAEHHAALRVTRYVTVTALLRFWGYANEHVKGEFIAGIYPEDVEEIVGVPGFAGAIEAAGWAIFDPKGGLTLPNFKEHNTSAGERSGAAERQKRYREKHRETDAPESDVTRNVTRDAQRREEKRREEKKDQKLEASPLGDEKPSPFGGYQPIADAYHALLPKCRAMHTLTDELKRKLAKAVKLAKRVCATQGWKYDPETFWRGYFTVCAQDPWLRGDTPNPGNANWKQNLGVLLADERLGEVIDKAIEAMRREA